VRDHAANASFNAEARSSAMPEGRSQACLPRIAVYTAITSRYEPLRNPSVITPGVRYFCFTDEPRGLSLINDTVWEILGIPKLPRLDPVRRARRVKILFHRVLQGDDFDYSIWVDGNVDIIGDLRPLLSTPPEHPIVGFRHPFRDCLYQEGEACIQESRDDPGRIRRQLEGYRAAGYPEHQGLTETNVLIRRHGDPAVMAVMEAWWEEVARHSKRDQLSFCYVMWRAGMTYGTMGNEDTRGSSPVFRTRDDWRHLPTEAPWRIYLARHLGLQLPRRPPQFKPDRWKMMLKSLPGVEPLLLGIKRVALTALTVNLGVLVVLLRAGPREALDRLRRSYAELQPFRKGISRLGRRGPALGGACAITAVVAGYCRGRGLEIGPGSRPYCPHDRTEYLDRFPDRAEGCVMPDIVADAQAIPRDDGSYDFVFSSHTLEHHPDTIGVLREWSRVLKPRGYLVLVLPHYTRTFDHTRPRTTLEHHLEDHALGAARNDGPHLDEFERVVAATRDRHPWTALEAARLPDGRLDRTWMVANGKVHYHVWDQDAVVRLIQHLGLHLVLATEDCADRSDSFMVVAQRAS
jgi:SAM-dependent methyltransferase